MCGSAVIFVSLAGCTSRSASTPTTPTVSCTAFAIDPSSTTVDANGGDRTIAVTANSECSWTAAVASGSDAIAITDGSSGKGNGTVKITVKVNPGAERRATITIGTATATVTVTIVQQASVPCTLSVDPTSAPFRSSGGSATITVTAQGTACTWTAQTSDPFITITSGASGTGNGTVAFTVAANTGAFRSGTLIVAGKTVTVTQDAVGVCVSSLAPASQTFDGGVNDGSIVVSAPDTCGWQVVSRASFVEITGAMRGNGNGLVAYRVAANSSGGVRTGTISIGGVDFVVIQSAPTVMAVYDTTFRTPLCDGVGTACDSGTLLQGSGTQERNQPNTIFSSCPDGSGIGHFAVVNAIRVEANDGSALAAGTRVRIIVSIVRASTADDLRVYHAPDARNPTWTLIAESTFGDFNSFSVPMTLPAGELQAIRTNFAFGRAFGPGPCATGTDDDNDDLVFRVRQ
jgi:Viral BACON domain